MTAHIHTALVHRFAVPAWLLVAVLAAVIALTLVAVLDNPAEPVAAAGLPRQLHRLRRGSLLKPLQARRRD